MADNIFNRAYHNTGGDGPGKPPYIIARVTKVITGPFLEDGSRDPDYNSVADLGNIKYVIENSAQLATFTGDSNKPAKPFFSFVHYYPTENEYVLIVVGPAVAANTDQPDQTDVYYFPPYNLWKAVNHNAQPVITEYAGYIQANNTSYADANKGLTQNGTTQPAQYPLGNGFVETDVRNLRPFVGDLLLEGRFGHSIRFGNSLKVNQNNNNWSVSNNESDPIIIIRNGQRAQTGTNPFDLSVENINVDPSSIYLTAGQVIDIEDLKGFPLTSWNVTIGSSQTNVTPIWAEMSFPPNANDSISPTKQDDILFS